MAVGALDFNHSLSWSPDGKVLAIVDKPAPPEPNSIILVSTESGDKHKLTSPPAGYFGDTYPEFSPDGKFVAFLRSSNGASGELHLIPAEIPGTPNEPARLTSGNRLIRGLTWTSDGSIAFGWGGLWRIPAPVAGRDAALEPERLEVNAEGAVWPRISPPSGETGARLVYMRSELDIDILRLPAEPHPAGNHLETAVRLIATTRKDSSAQYSPDGKRIAFGSSRSGEEDIWVCDAEGQNPVQLTFLGRVSTGSPRWSPDGRWLAFDSLEEGFRHIYVIAAEGGTPRRLTNEKQQHSRPAWSRDGSSIYFSSNRTGVAGVEDPGVGWTGRSDYAGGR